MDQLSNAAGQDKVEAPRTRRLPPWLTVRAPNTDALQRLKPFVDGLGLNTVCESAQCPNRGECFGRGTATFMILGDVCTRNCNFCAVGTGRPQPLDDAEPQKVARAVRALGLRHAVITSVTRDDLPDGGAHIFAATIGAIRELCPNATVEVLIPDFRGSAEALEVVVRARPDILNHNVETVARLYRVVRPQAVYGRSIQLIANVKRLDPATPTKSGMMLGLGETRDEVIEVMRDLRGAGCDIVTLGQYLRPSREHLPVVEYIAPDVFAEYKRLGEDLGFSFVASGPLIRSSFNAGEAIQFLKRV